MQKLILLGIASLTTFGLVVACSADDLVPNVPNGTSSSSSGSSGTSSSGGSSGSSDGKIVNGQKVCPAQGGGENNCPQAEVDAYAKCATDNCDAEYKEALGADYKSGTLSGVCKSYFDCTNACACNDTACTQKCTLDQACQSAFTKLGQCITSKCKIPCQDTSGGGDGKTCADLQACCGKITDATKKSQCTQTYDAIKGSGDSVCNGVYSQYAADCP